MSEPRPVVVVVAEAAPMRGGIATFAETITADRRLQEQFDVRLLNTARTATRAGGKLSLSNVGYALSDAWRTYREARHADIVHLQLVADPGLPCLRAAALNLAASAGRARLIAHVHSAVGNAGRPEFASYGRLDRLALRTLRRASMVCTVSNVGTETMRHFAGGAPVTTVDNAVEVSGFAIATPTQGPPTVLFVGVICRRKGTVELARASRALLDQGVVDWDLVVVGGRGPTPPDEYDAILGEFAAAGLQDALVGPEYGDQVKDRLKAADIFVLPSYLEGQPIAIIEAMASGLPVIASSVGAVPDLIRDGIEGRVVEPGDVPALAAALGELIGDPARRAAMAAASHQRAEQFHNLEGLSRRLSAIYAAVLNEPARTLNDYSKVTL